MPTTRTLEPVSAPIDPRIRARRIEVRRHEGRRRLQRLVDLGVVTLVALGFAGALWTPLLDVDAVAISGATHTGAGAVARAGRGRGRGSLDRASICGASGARVAALPWVGEVHLSRGVNGRVEHRRDRAHPGRGRGQRLGRPARGRGRARPRSRHRRTRDRTPRRDHGTGRGRRPRARSWTPPPPTPWPLPPGWKRSRRAALATLDATDLTGTLVQGGRGPIRRRPPARREGAVAGHRPRAGRSPVPGTCSICARRGVRY